MQEWNREKARDTYNITRWGEGYFDINEQGHAIACPDPFIPDNRVDLYRLSQEICAAGLSLPVLVRFADILHHRVRTLCKAFEDAMRSRGYQGTHTAVYPIKVNQQRSVIEEILAGRQDCAGLEAGSKAELMAVLALSHEGAIIVCNGYKDREYIRLALIGQQLGHRVVIVIEKLSELEHVIRESNDLGVQPVLGMRVRLSAIGEGKWQNTGGEKSKFGLLPNQVLEVVAHLENHEMLDCMQLLHFHMGSQISSIQDIRRGMQEACRYYAELHDLGVTINCIDVGGGLGVDYEGTQSRSFFSMNYNMQEYADTVVLSIADICHHEGLPFPDIITESGRALTAHHAMLITNVIDVEKSADRVLQQPHENDPVLLHSLAGNLRDINEHSLLEVYRQATGHLQETRKKYIQGEFSLQQRSIAESYYQAISHRVRGMLKPSVHSHMEILDELNKKLADKYFCNFSIFQSMPDVWAIQQVFPIMPLHKLDRPPARRAVIQDLTCDSDGRIDLYVDSEGMESSLPLHEWSDNEPYILGLFMVGAYQEILGDMHNLFGDTDSVNVSINDDGTHQLSHDKQGDTVEEVLRYVNFEPQQMLAQYREKINRAGLDEGRSSIYLAELEAGLRGYTYHED
mgnify:CR=1 FL=1